MKLVEVVRTIATEPVVTKQQVLNLSFLNSWTAERFIDLMIRGLFVPIMSISSTYSMIICLCSPPVA